MKTIFVLVLSIFLLYGMFRYATFDRGEGYLDLESQSIHTIICMDGYGNIETYHINIPKGINLDYFSKGFCDSLEEK